ncbi:MAG: DUF2510 domain-containing protein [Solirubrobacterales bacterium]
MIDDERPGNPVGEPDSTDEPRVEESNPSSSGVTESTPVAGWYPDPDAPGQQRYWDGNAWGESQAVASTPDAVVNTTIKSDQDRKAALALQLQFAAAQGGRIESQSDFQAVVVKGQKVNHVLHAIVTLFTCVWGIAWIVFAINGGESREMIVVDEFGNVQIQRLGKS